MNSFADIVIHNARVMTQQPGAPEADWIAVSGRTVSALGLGSAARHIGPQTRVVDAGGATVLPGLNDAHLHLFAGGLSLSQLSLVGVSGQTDFRAAVAAYRASRPGLSFLAASGCDYRILGQTMLDRHALDAICADIPMLVMAADYHTAWANTAALQLAGIAQGADVGEGSEIVLDADGFASGELREFAAIDRVRACNPAAKTHSRAAQAPLELPEVTEAERAADKEVLWQALLHCAAQGLTAVQNMDGSLYQLDLLAELDRERGLPVRVRMPFQITEGMSPEALAQAARWRRSYATPMLRCDFVKIFADGVIESGTANLLADYAHLPGHSGAPLLSDDHLRALVVEADRLGFQIAVHCVGDGAVRQVLDAFEVARRQNGWREARHRIEHIELVDAGDLGRFARWGVVASTQPTHVPEAGEGYLDLIGTQRSSAAFAVADLRDAGAEIVFSTDWPIAPLSPFVTLEAALARPDWPGARDHRVGLAAALGAITRAAAWIAFDEAERGRLTPGMLADLTLLDRDLSACPLSEIATTTARLTICDGQVTHDTISPPSRA